MTAILCPVCNGMGKVPQEYYNPPPSGITPISTTGGIVYVPCRGCGGRGVIVDKEPRP